MKAGRPANSGKTKSFRGRKLTTFPNLSKFQHCTLFSFDGNPLENFKGMISCPNLTDLYLDNTKMSSFFEAPELPSLERISLKHSPLGFYKKLDLMCAIVFGPQLQFVNGEELSHEKVRFALEYRDLLLPYFRQGWVMTSTNPVRFIHYKTRARISVKLPSKKSENENPNDEIQFDDENQEYQDDENDHHSEYNVFEDENASTDDDNVDQAHQRAEMTMKKLSTDWSNALKKKEAREENYVELQAKRANNYNQEPTFGMRKIVRKPGGVIDPFTLSPQLNFEQKPLPEIEMPLHPKPTLRISMRSTPVKAAQPVEISNNDDSFNVDASEEPEE
ncbi:hypothetical protein TRFO_16676 [Tritrichomonas foetus]|uniref:Leucine Rich Repeat family protein n=1 Tax=Tritrichomonas foetus TaxID=1144522 RepID=A0A1J4KQ46_9EUKA|nr:hypothetical protein TRFO_16676 [Tritrichomonas foetus]|eukprot:OHT13234.1 hypothetical protein TRFO_16676 [Tritrichomonas foetus]